MNPWTQRATVSWRPALAFFERRYSILRAFEDAGLLHQFRIEEDSVSVRLGDANHEIYFSARGLELAMFQPDGDFERLANATRAIIDHLEPKHLLRPEFNFQWLVPLDGDYDEVRRRTAGAVLPSFDGEATDFAVLVDGSRSKSTYVFEAGIVDAAEIPQRLSGVRGRVRRPGQIEAPPSLWPPDELPQVAFYADSVVFERVVEEATSDGFLSAWQEMRDIAFDIVGKVMKEFDVHADE